MDDRTIARWRLRTQRLHGERHATADAVVRGFLAVQGENVSHTLWALACRTTGSTTARNVGALLDSGTILRTHVLRPTWHLVVPDDLVWLSEITRPRMRRWVTQEQRAQGIGDAALDRAVETLIDAIEHDGPLIRDEVRARLDRSGPSLSLVLCAAEFDALVCSGPRRGTEHTYDLVTRRAPNAERRDETDALAELARRYVAGHGPVTERDLAYWATMSVTGARAALRTIEDELASFTHDGRTYWHLRDSEPPTSTVMDSTLLLHLFDEMYRGYQDSRYVLDADGLFPREREASLGMVLIDGQYAATVKRVIGTRAVEFVLAPLRPIGRHELDAIDVEAARCAAFLEVAEARVTVT
jgi:hypothetical protein